MGLAKPGTGTSEEMTTPTLPNLTRATAFDWLGKHHWIPANMAVRWLHADLVAALEGLQRGATIALDYRGTVPDAPHFALERSATGTLTLRFLTGPADAPRKSSKSPTTWPPTDHPARTERIVHDMLALILKRRRASGVVLVSPPRE